MIIGIVGTRRRNSLYDKEQIKKELLKILEEYSDVKICSGGCSRGGDYFAEELSKEFKLEIKIYKADWHKFGKAAGFIRNTDIARESDILIACVAPDRKGGAEDTIKKFKKFHPDGKVVLVE
jgi:hypothetical protein